jgi:predicted secreted protein
MPVFSAIVLFAFLWFLTFLVVLPLRLHPPRPTRRCAAGSS